MYKRILVAIDGSETSNLGLRHAIQLAKEQHAQLRLVHALDNVVVESETYAEMTDLWNARKKSGQALLQKARSLAAKAAIEPETKLLESETFGQRIADSIVEEAERCRADLIVLGTHGRRGLSHVFLGSVAEGVVRISTTPVLLIRGLAGKPKRRRSRSR